MCCAAPTARTGSAPRCCISGSLYQRHFKTSEIVPPVLERLSAEVHEGASFYVCEEDKRVCLHRIEASRAVRDSIHVGDRLPLTVGAAGHVLRAFSNGRGERFDEIRRRMYAASFGERDSETAAIAAPVFGPGNALVGALSVSGPRYRIEAAGEGRIVPILFKYAKELTRTFGGNVDDPTLAGWNLPARRRQGRREGEDRPTRLVAPEPQGRSRRSTRRADASSARGQEVDRITVHVARLARRRGMRSRLHVETRRFSQANPIDSAFVAAVAF